MVILCTWAMVGPVFAQVVVSGGPGFDYQADVIQPWGEPQSRIVVFERLSQPGLSGDLLATRSDDGGGSWSAPAVIVGTAANERHPALVQTADTQYQLFYLSNAGSDGFRIHRASSTDGTGYTEHGALDLGWATGGEINPHVIRHHDGMLSMTYHRLGGAAYIAQSGDGGVTWDDARTQISPGNAALPRVALRASDGRYLAVYQTNPGNNQLQLWIKTTDEPADWNVPAQPLTTGGNNHDALPLVLPDGRFIVLWARVADGNFQIFSTESEDGKTWSEPVQRVHRPGLANVQPHAIVLPGGVLDLYWGAAQDAAGNDYDIVRQVLGPDQRFRDRFEH